MPYCPKCDMEFIDGITTCSDCGGELVESKEAAMELKKQEEEARREQMMEEMARMSKMAQDGQDSSAEGGWTRDGEDYGDADGEAKAEAPESPIAPARIYVNKEQKYEDLKSSASAFLIVGVILLAAAVVCWSGIISLPLNDVSKIIVQSVITIMGILSIFVAGSSFKSAKTLAPQIEDENKATQELIQWFQDSYTGEQIDNAIEGAEDLTPEELSLKRFQLIQDYLITSHDLPDQAYVDALSEEIYGKLYE